MSHKLFLCLLALPLLCGCGNGDSTLSNSPQSSVVRRAANFTFVLSLPKQRYALGEVVPITLKVTNELPSKRTLICPSQSKIVYVITQGSTVIVRGTRVGGAATAFVTIEPLAEFTESIEWIQNNLQGNTVPTGQYTVRAYMPANSLDGADYTGGRAEAELYTQTLDISIGE